MFEFILSHKSIILFYGIIPYFMVFILWYKGENVFFLDEHKIILIWFEEKWHTRLLKRIIELIK